MATQPLPKKGAEPPIFGPCVLWQNCRMDQGGTWHGGHIVLDRGPSFRERAIAAPPLFGPCLLWPRSPISATAELSLLYPRPLTWPKEFLLFYMCQLWALHVFIKWQFFYIYICSFST